MKSLAELIGHRLQRGKAQANWYFTTTDARIKPRSLVSAGAETINVYDDHGGSVAEYDARWSELAARGANVRVVGPCQSACTVLLARIPNERICVTPQAAFGFHLAHRPDAAATLWAGYNAGIREWINARGGLTTDFKWMRAPDTYRFFRKC